MRKYTLFTTASAAADVTASPPMIVADCLYGAVQVVFTGTDVVGTFKLQHSVDGTNYVDITGQSISVSTSVGGILSFGPVGDGVATGPGTNAQFVRFYWDYTSGTGNMTVTGMLKEAVFQ